MNIVLWFGLAYSAMTASSVEDTVVYSIDAHIISSGTSVHTSSACFGLDAVIAEPIVGFATGGMYALSAGFGYAAPAVSDNIFGSGFEDCSR